VRPRSYEGAMVLDDWFGAVNGAMEA